MKNTKISKEFTTAIAAMDKAAMAKFQREYAVAFNMATDGGSVNLPYLLERLLELRYTTLVKRGVNISLLSREGYGSRGGIRPYVRSRAPFQNEPSFREFVVAFPPCGPLTFRCILIGAITSYLQNHGHDNASKLASKLGISRATVRTDSENYEIAIAALVDFT